MMKIVLGLVSGFILWSVIFVGGEALLRMVSPALVAPQDAVYFDSTGILLGYLLRSIIASIAAGWLAAAVARDGKSTPLILGIVFLIVGLIVQISAWSVLPIWYHLVFLILLIPMTVLGGKLYNRA